MEIAIFQSEIGVQLTATVDILETEAKKFHENLKTIHNMEMDLNLTVSCHDNKDFLFIRNVVVQDNEKKLSDLKKEFFTSIEEFMEAFHKLCIEEAEKKENPEAPTKKEIEFVKNLVEPDMLAVVGTILCKDGYCDIRISSKVFSQMCNAYIEKYGS